MLLQLRWWASLRPFALISVLLLWNSPASGFFDKWPEVNEEELAMSAPKIDPTAPAEILYHETIIDDRNINAKFKYYKRVKIFDARAIESFSPLNISYRKGTRIRNVEARVIKPNGEIVELEKADVYDREIYRRGNIRTRVRSVTIPGIEPGCIVEYRWESIGKGQAVSRSLYTPVQEFPVHHSYFEFVPWAGWRVYFKWYAMPTEPVVKSGRVKVELYDVVAEPDDSFQPPYYDCYPWLSCYYFAPKGALTPDVYWPEMANRLGDWNKRLVTPKHRAIKRKAAELVAGASTDEERIQRIYDFCVKEIKNYDWPDSGFTLAEIYNLPTNDKPVQTLDRGYGDSSDLIMLFASLAGAAGLDAQLSLVNDSSMAAFNEDLVWYMGVPDFLVAIRKDDKYTFYDIATRHLPPGELLNRNSGVQALVGRSEKDWKWVTTQTMPEDHSRIEQTANLVLDEQGNLTGHVELRYFGDDCLDLKSRIETMTSDGRRDYFRNQLRGRLSGADLFEPEFLNLVGYGQPLTVRYQISVPHYAEVLGDRLLVSPSFFEKGKQPFFISESRKTGIFFDRGWNRAGTVFLKLPSGWSMESEGGPSGVVDTERFSHTTSLETSDGFLKFSHNERAVRMMLPMEAYQQVKTVFEEINRQNQIPVIFRQIAASE